MPGFISQTPHVVSETSWQFEAFEKSFTVDHTLHGNMSLWYQTSVLYFCPLGLPAECRFNFVFSVSILTTPDHLSMLQTSGEA